jgi:signal transduction histidine kinase
VSTSGRHGGAGMPPRRLGSQPTDKVPAPPEPTVRPAAEAEARSAESAPMHPDPAAQTESELRALCDGLLKQLEDERARLAGLLGDELVSVMTATRHLIEDAAQRLARGEREVGAEALQNASARIRDITDRLVALSSELRPGAPPSTNDR